MTELFLKIINMSISASWLILAVLLLRLVLKKAPRWVRVLLWGIVAVRLICPISLESALSLIPSAETLPEQMISGPSFDVQTGIAPVDDRINDYLGSRYYEGVTVPAHNGFTVMSTLTVIWLIGILLLAAYSVFSYLRLRRNVDTAVIYKDNIFQSDQIGSPFVLGLISPKIYVPFHISGQDFQHVVAHEQAHLRRKDHLWKPLGFLLLTLHWFNPLMWLAYIFLCRDIELACDEKVIKELGSDQRADYTQALVACSVDRPMIAACPLAFGEVGVKERVKSVMNYKKPAFLVIVLAVTACVGIAVCFLTDPIDNALDASFLNYKNFIPTVADVGELLVIYCPPSDDSSGASIQVGKANGADLAKQLDLWNWKECKPPRQSLPSPGSVEFIIDNHYRFTVHQRKPGSLYQYAVVTYQDDVRYYRIDRSDYSEAVALVHSPTQEPSVLNAKVLEIHDGYFLVEPVEGSRELISANRIKVPVQNANPSPEPQTGDIIAVSYNGVILETSPAQLREVYSIRVIQDTDSAFGKYYLTIGADGVKSIAVTTPDFSGGCENADGSLFKKGERVWLDNLDGFNDLRGVTLSALDESGKIIWSVSIPDGDENNGFSFFIQGDWAITKDK